MHYPVHLSRFAGLFDYIERIFEFVWALCLYCTKRREKLHYMFELTKLFNYLIIVYILSQFLDKPKIYVNNKCWLRLRCDGKLKLLLLLRLLHKLVFLPLSFSSRAGIFMFSAVTLCLRAFSLSFVFTFSSLVWFTFLLSFVVLFFQQHFGLSLPIFYCGSPSLWFPLVFLPFVFLWVRN